MSISVDVNSNNTIGMRIDALIDEINSIPTMCACGAFCIFSLVFAFVLLNYGGANDNGNTTSTKPSKRISAPVALKTKDYNENEPRWCILKRLNCIFVFSFVISIMLFASNASECINDQSTLLMFLIGWGAFLSYFFGFFGISFVDADEIVQQADVLSSPKR